MLVVSVMRGDSAVGRVLLLKRMACTGSAQPACCHFEMPSVAMCRWNISRRWGDPLDANGLDATRSGAGGRCIHPDCPGPAAQLAIGPTPWLRVPWCSLNASPSGVPATPAAE